MKTLERLRSSIGDRKKEAPIEKSFRVDAAGETLVCGTETYLRLRNGAIYNIEGITVDPMVGESVLVTGQEAVDVSRRMNELSELGRR